MKKTIAILLMLALCLGLCACSIGKKVELPAVPTAAAEPAETASPAEQEPEQTPEPEPTAALASDCRVIVKLDKTELTADDPQSGEKTILRFSYETPTVIMEENPDAAARINEFIGLLNESFYTGEDYGEGYGTGYNNMLTEAEDLYNYMAGNGMNDSFYELAAERSYAVARNDGRILTLLCNDYTYTGGAHGIYGTRAYCFDVSTGEVLTLDDITDNADALRALLKDRISDLAANDPDINERISGFMSDEELAAGLEALIREGSWYFDQSGIKVFSDVYEISSYAAGMVGFPISYEELGDLVYDRYRPAAAGDGSFRTVAGDAFTDGSMEIVDFVKAFQDGQTVYFVADGPVSEVRLSRVDFSYSFYETAQLWYCSHMENAALQVVTVIPDGMPNLKLSWRDAQGEQSVVLTQSGEDGSLILLPADEIEAVG